MQAKLSWNGKMGFVGVSGSNHALVMDVRKESGAGIHKLFPKRTYVYIFRKNYFQATW
jgi:uncharacterized OsmC-like protein